MNTAVFLSPRFRHLNIRLVPPASRAQRGEPAPAGLVTPVPEAPATEEARQRRADLFRRGLALHLGLDQK